MKHKKVKSNKMRYACTKFQVEEAEDGDNSPERWATSLFPLGPASVLRAIFYQVGHQICHSVLPHICDLYGQRKAASLSLSLISRFLGASRSDYQSLTPTMT